MQNSEKFASEEVEENTDSNHKEVQENRIGQKAVIGLKILKRGSSSLITCILVGSIICSLEWSSISGK